MAAQDTGAVARRGGKRATPPGYQKTYRTAVFKLHNPSQKKRAMLRDCMRRAHLSYTKLLDEFMPPQAEVERLAKLPKMERRRAFQPIAAACTNKAQNIGHLPLAARDGNRVDALAQIKSYIGLQDEHGEVIYIPTEAGMPILEAGKR